ncbi:MAG: chemotaxis-specific protein-glutamate methyltransferase CheB [Mycobacteriales bacterium]
MSGAEPGVRVLVVDDSVVTRRVVARALQRDPDIATDYASNGRLALAKIDQRRPDVVVLDLEMPELDGFGTLTALRRSHPDLPVVLFSSMDERVATDTLEALSLGVTDFVLKPTAASLQLAEAYVEEHLTPLVKALAGTRSLRPRRARPDTRAPQGVVEAIVVGVSTGGPDALATVVRELPADLRVPILVVQHMPPMFTRLLAERLDRLGQLPVVEAGDGQEVVGGCVYIAPGDHHLEVDRSGPVVLTRLTRAAPENSCRPAADVLFRSAAQVYGAGVLAVVLTGMGADGLRGCERVRTAGGQVVVQDPQTALIGSMPGSVADAGLAQAIVALDQMAAELVQRVGATR